MPGKMPISLHFQTQPIGTESEVGGVKASLPQDAAGSYSLRVLHRVRESLVQNKVKTTNQMPVFLLEFGVSVLRSKRGKLFFEMTCSPGTVTL